MGFLSWAIPINRRRSFSDAQRELLLSSEAHVQLTKLKEGMNFLYNILNKLTREENEFYYVARSPQESIELVKKFEEFIGILKGLLYEWDGFLIKQLNPPPGFKVQNRDARRVAWQNFQELLNWFSRKSETVLFLAQMSGMIKSGKIWLILDVLNSIIKNEMEEEKKLATNKASDMRFRR